MQEGKSTLIEGGGGVEGQPESCRPGSMKEQFVYCPGMVASVRGRIRTEYF